MQRKMKRKYESPQCETIESESDYQLLAGSYTEKDPEPYPSGEGYLDD